MADLAAELAAAAITDTLIRSESPLGEPYVKPSWETVIGACVGEAGWRVSTAYNSGQDGARYTTTAYVASQTTYVYTIGTISTSSTQTAERWYGLWALMDESEQTGYRLRIELVNLGTKEHTIYLEKAEGGEYETLAEKTGVVLPTGAGEEVCRAAILVGGGQVAAYIQGAGEEGFEEVLSAEDSSITEGYGAMEGKGNFMRLKNLSIGSFSTQKLHVNAPTHTVWTYILTELDGTEINEIRQGTERKVSMALNKPSTASFSVRPDNPILTPLFADDTLLKVYEGTTLRFFGPVVSSELSTQDDGSAPTIKVNAADPAWKLSRRLLGLSSGGTAYEGDKAKIARKMINELNTNTEKYPTNPETGIKLLAEGEYEAGGEGKYTAGPYKSALTCINDLAHGLDGFDWYMAPLDNTSEKMVTFEADATYGGTAAAVFEHGFGQRNVRKLNYLRDLAGLANKAFHLPDEGFEEGSEVKTAADATSIEHRGRYEAIADGYGLVDSTLRQNWVDEFVRVRKNPRFVVSMTLDVDDNSGRVPQIGTDFFLGDLVTARSVINGVTMFDGVVRVYQIQVDINDAGTGTVTPVLIDEEGGEL